VKSWIQRVAFLFMLSAIAVASTVAVQDGWFRIELVEIGSSQDLGPWNAELQRITEETTNKLRHRWIWDVSLEEIQKDLVKEPWIESAQVNRQFPASLRIKITTSAVAGVFMNYKGEFRVVGREGYLSGYKKLSSYASYPVFRNPKIVNNKELRNLAIEILENLPPEGRFSKKSISSIDLEKSGKLLFHLIGGNHRIHFGKESIRTKIERVNEVIEYLDRHEISDRVIDANYELKVLVSPRNRR